VAHNFGTKEELFAQDPRAPPQDSPFNVNNSNNSQENMQEEENRKTYTALL
jgi:hypothetical protein